MFGDNIIAKMLFYDAKKLKEEFFIEAFCVDKEYLKGTSFCGMPLLSFEDALKCYPPDEYDMISTIDASSNLRKRLEVFDRIKDAGYLLRNYVSPLADVSETIEMGENNLIFPFAHMGYGGKIGNANMIRQNVYLGHDFIVGDGNTITAGCTLAGYCKLENSCYIGIGAVVIEHTRIARDTLIGAGSVVIRNTEPATTYVGNPARAVSTHEETGIMIKVRRE